MAYAGTMLSVCYPLAVARWTYGALPRYQIEILIFRIRFYFRQLEQEPGYAAILSSAPGNLP